jgi:hypothetical protein
VQTVLPNDAVYVFTRSEDDVALSHVFMPQPEVEALREREFFGDFVLGGEASLAQVCEAYGVRVPEELAGLTLRETLARRFQGRPVVGDRLDLGDIELVVRISGGRSPRSAWSSTRSVPGDSTAGRRCGRCAYWSAGGRESTLRPVNMADTIPPPSFTSVTTTPATCSTTSAARA